jgi:hypothetical protein
MENTLNLMKYEIFLAEQITEQDAMNKYIQECILIESDSISAVKMNAINEGAIDKVKETIHKIIEAIAKMWNKFLESAKKLLSTDKNYLEKYKDIILKKQLKEAEYNTYDYAKGIPILLATSVPAFNYDSMKDELVSDEQFINKYFKAFASEKIEFVDNVKAVFRNGHNGGSDRKTFKSNEFNMTDIYNYCYNYKSLIQKIEKDIEYVKKAGIDAIKIVDSESKNQSTQQTTQNNNQTQQQNDQNSNNNQQNITKEGFYYSNISNSIVHELERTLPNGQTNTGGAKTSSGSTADNANPAKNVQNISGDNSNSNDTRAAVSGHDPKAVGEHINRYMRICGDILGAKLSITQEIYKEYMSLIRLHVRDYVGTKDADEQNKPIEKGTDYNNNNQQQGDNQNNKSTGKKISNTIENIGNKVSGYFNSSKNL